MQHTYVDSHAELVRCHSLGELHHANRRLDRRSHRSRRRRTSRVSTSATRSNPSPFKPRSFRQLLLEARHDVVDFDFLHGHRRLLCADSEREIDFEELCRGPRFASTICSSCSDTESWPRDRVEVQKEKTDCSRRHRADPSKRQRWRTGSSVRGRTPFACRSVQHSVSFYWCSRPPRALVRESARCRLTDKPISCALQSPSDMRRPLAMHSVRYGLLSKLRE